MTTREMDLDEEDVMEMIDEEDVMEMIDEEDVMEMIDEEDVMEMIDEEDVTGVTMGVVEVVEVDVEVDAEDVVNLLHLMLMRFPLSRIAVSVEIR